MQCTCDYNQTAYHQVAMNGMFKSPVMRCIYLHSLTAHPTKANKQPSKDHDGTFTLTARHFAHVTSVTIVYWIVRKHPAPTPTMLHKQAHSGKSARIRESNHGSGVCKEHYA